MLTCRELTRTIASEEFAEAGWRRRLGVRFHLAMCRYCRRYVAQQRVIGESVRRILRSGDADSATLDRLERAKIEPLTSVRPAGRMALRSIPRKGQ